MGAYVGAAKRGEIVYIALTEILQDERTRLVLHTDVFELDVASRGPLFVFLSLSHDKLLHLLSGVAHKGDPIAA